MFTLLGESCIMVTMRLLSGFCIAFACAMVSSLSSTAWSGLRGPVQRKNPPVKPLFRVVEPGNAMYKLPGRGWQKLRKGQSLPPPVEVVTQGTPAQLTVGTNGEVQLTIYPNSSVGLSSFANSAFAKLDPNETKPDTQITVVEDLADKGRAKGPRQPGFLSAFRVLSRLSGLTLGGHGTSYTVYQHYDAFHLLDGMGVWENDSAAPNRVDVFVAPSTNPVSVIAANEHKWVDLYGKLHSP
jgi:hypothetical protein